MKITPEQADAIWTVLVKCCGAKESDRNKFVALSPWNTEYRFQGSLGFGGKFYIEPEGWRVSCYPEDRTELRALAIDAANARLNRLFEEAIR